MHLSGSSRALIIHGEGGRLALTNPLLPPQFLFAS